MSGQAAMLSMIAGMHLLGLLCAAALLIPALRGPEAPPNSDGGSDGGGGGAHKERSPHPKPPRGGLPLPDAVPARVRLRDHRRLADLLPQPARRPQHAPERAPERVF